MYLETFQNSEFYVLKFSGYLQTFGIRERIEKNYTVLYKIAFHVAKRMRNVWQSVDEFASITDHVYLHIQYAYKFALRRIT